MGVDGQTAAGRLKFILGGEGAAKLRSSSPGSWRYLFVCASSFIARAYGVIVLLHY